MDSAWPTGFVLGFLIAAQVGPIWLLCARSTMAAGWRAGVAIGAGAAAVDVAYAGLGLAGAAAALQIHGLRLVLGLAGVAVLTLVGARTLWSAARRRRRDLAGTAALAPMRALRIAVAATAANPATIVSWAAVFAAAGPASSPSGAAVLLAGVAVGSLLWFVVLTTALAVLRHRVSRRGLCLVDVASGLGILGFAGVLGWQTLQAVQVFGPR